MDSLLLEIGTEEIPAGYIQPALAALASNLAQKLTANRIDHGAITTFGTPRRLSVMADQVASRQRLNTERILGPPERVGFDAQGLPTMAAIKFAAKVGCSPSQLQIVDIEKGRYLSATITDAGKNSRSVLQRLLPEVILSLPFPKSMRWADYKMAFARPIHSVIALLGGRVISFRLDSAVKSGRLSVGHRFMHPGRIRLAQAQDYVPALREGQVVVDLQERRSLVESEIRQAAARLGGRIFSDDALVDLVTNLVELPFAVGGRFEEIFLELPREILITSMREHQKYFAVVDADDRLMPCFVAVNNTRCKNPQLVVNGHQRVLRARLSDARFFYRADCRQTMDQWRNQLKGVLFQAKLGSMFAKSERIEQLAAFLARLVSPGHTGRVTRAAQLCKADLVSQVVVEFPNLQGVMGRHYAGLAGEDAETAIALEEQYRPTSSGGALPETLTGALLAIADKLDTICGCFAVGLQPSGTSDPYALRRQGIGIVQIMMAFGMKFSLGSAIAECIKHFERGDEGTAAAAYEFFRSRIIYMLTDQGFAKDVVAAVGAVSVDCIPDVWKRAEALQDLRMVPDFEPLAIAFKRVVNILRKTGETHHWPVDPSLFEDPCELSLWQRVQDAQLIVEQFMQKEELLQSLKAIAALRPSVDLFFDRVMVMSDNPEVRRNRLALLQAIADMFEKFADFSKITTP